MERMQRLANKAVQQVDGDLKGNILLRSLNNYTYLKNERKRERGRGNIVILINELHGKYTHRGFSIVKRRNGIFDGS